MPLLHRILTIASEADWIVNVPKLSKLEEPDVRIRWEPQEVIAALIRAMSLPWMRDVALFAVSTGMRETEILSLTRSRIDMKQCNAWGDGRRSQIWLCQVGFR